MASEPKRTDGIATRLSRMMLPAIVLFWAGVCVASPEDLAAAEQLKRRETLKSLLVYVPMGAFSENGVSFHWGKETQIQEFLRKGKLNSYLFSKYAGPDFQAVGRGIYISLDPWDSEVFVTDAFSLVVMELGKDYPILDIVGGSQELKGFGDDYTRYATKHDPKGMAVFVKDLVALGVRAVRFKDTWISILIPDDNIKIESIEKFVERKPNWFTQSEAMRTAMHKACNALATKMAATYFPGNSIDDLIIRSGTSGR